MNALVRKLLDSFDDLSEADQHELTIEILRRTSQLETDTPSDDSLTIAADHVFRELDEREAADADPSSR